MLLVILAVDSVRNSSQVRTIETGELFGEISMLSREPTPGDIIAVNHCRVYKVRRTMLMLLLPLLRLLLVSLVRLLLLLVLTSL